MFYWLDCKWLRSLSRGIPPPDCGTVAAFPVTQWPSSTAQFRPVLRVACCLSGEGVGILQRVCHFVPNITWETEVSTEAVMEFVRECPNLYGKSRADNSDDIKRTKYGTGWSLWIQFLPHFVPQPRNICVTSAQSYCNYVRKCYCSKSRGPQKYKLFVFTGC